MRAMTNPLIEADHLHLSFGQTPALRGASVSVDSGEFLASMGPSGSGKSTLLHCLAGIFMPAGGEVRYDGRSLGNLGDKQRTKLRRTEFGFVFQFGQLVPELSAADNIAMPLLLNGTRRAAAYRQAGGWLDRLELGELSARRTGELSGGQAQRIAIARALVSKPRVLFADEPTGALDSLTGKQIMSLLTRVARAEGTAIILVSHDRDVARYADRTVQVSDGRVTAAELAGVVG
jgi:putative ABC transport system ATP-binding protein